MSAPTTADWLMFVTERAADQAMVETIVEETERVLQQARRGMLSADDLKFQLSSIVLGR